MEDIQDHMTESITTLKETAGAYSEHLSSIKERIEKIKEEERQAKAEEEAKHDHKEGKNGPYCQCKIFLDLMKENDTEKELEVLHKELLQTNSDVLSTLSQESKAYSNQYQALKKEYKRNLELRMSTQKHILKCPTVTFDRATKHKDVTITEEGALVNQTVPNTDERDKRELSNVTGAVANKRFTRTDIAYFGLKADVQIVRTKKIEKARLYDIFDVYMGSSELIDQLRDPGVLYQLNMFGINVWYSNTGEEVLVDVLGSTKHVDRYTIASQVKHGDRFDIEIGILVDMPRETIHVFDHRNRKLIGTVRGLSTYSALWPAVQIHHCYYEPQYFDTQVRFMPLLEDVKTDKEFRKYLLTLVKEGDALFL